MTPGWPLTARRRQDVVLITLSVVAAFAIGFEFRIVAVSPGTGRVGSSTRSTTRPRATRNGGEDSSRPMAPSAI